MKLKSFLLACGLTLVSSVYANTLHKHPKAEVSTATTAQAPKSLMSYGCNISIWNNSYSNVVVNGVFDDNSPLASFPVYSFGPTEEISLYYYGYCHNNMWLDIRTFGGYIVYQGYTGVGTDLEISDYYGLNQLKVTSSKK